VIAALDRARTRLRARMCGAGGDEGFTLIYTLLVTMLVTILVASSLVVATANVVPSVRSTLAQAAEAAAWSGVDAFRADLDKQCGTSDHLTVDTCTSVATSGNGTINTDSSTYQAKYAYTAAPGTKWFRVTSTGTVVGGTLTMSRTIVADIAGGAKTSVLAYNVVVGYETQAPDVVMAQFPKRAISLDASARSATGLSSGSSVLWSGAQNSANAGSVNICNALYAGLTGRSHNPPPNASTPYVDWLESGTAGSTSFSDYQPCQVSLGHSTKLETTSASQGSGGYATHDALLLSNSFPGGSGPLLNQPVWTSYQYDASTATACDTPNQDYRSFTLTCAGYGVEVGGSPASGSAYTPQFLSGIPTNPTGAPTVASGSCVYVGPTRIRLNAAGTATVTSPYTTSAQSGSPASCYPSTGFGSGIYGYTTPTITSMIGSGFTGIFYATNGGAKPTTPSCTDSATATTMTSSSGWNVTCQRVGDAATASNAVFFQSGGTAGTTTSTSETATGADASYVPATGDNPSAKSDGAWTPKWTSFSTGTTCSTSTSVLDLKFFNCYQSGGAYSAAAYGSFKTTVKNALAASPTSYDTASKLQTYLTTLLSAGNSSDAGNSTPTNATNASHRWQVTVAADAATTDGCTPASNVTGSTTNTTIGAPSSDPLFSNVSGTSAATPTTSTACYTATVVAQIGQSILTLGKSWGDGGLLGLGLVAGSTIPQFKVTFTVKTTSTSTTVTPSYSVFPNVDSSGKYTDATQYSLPSSTSAPGDLYLDGTANTTVAFVADNDTVLTGSLTNSSTSDAVEVVARDDVRVYHPVTCTTTANIATTTPGFCPNDVTGLYSGVLSDTNLRGDKVYTNLSTGLNDITINAAVFALGGVSKTCPQPTTGADAGICGGEFSVDNYNRGGQLGTITVKGTLVMQHHGPVGHEWEIADTSGQASRPYSGYQLDLKYANLASAITDPTHAAIGGVVSTTTTTSSLWHVVSVSTGGN